MYIILQALAVVILFIGIKALLHCLIDNHKLPNWLNYKPFNCMKCASFWSMVFTYVILGLSLKAWWLLGIGLLLTALDTAATIIDEKNTVSIYDEDYE